MCLYRRMRDTRYTSRGTRFRDEPYFLRRAYESVGLSEHPRMDFYFHAGDFFGGNIQHTRVFE